MSTLLKHIETDFERRLTLRRRMFANLRIELSETRAQELLAENRETLLACASCAYPQACEHWLDAGCGSAPMFCKARAAFLRLQIETRSDAPLAAVPRESRAPGRSRPWRKAPARQFPRARLTEVKAVSEISE